MRRMSAKEENRIRRCVQDRLMWFPATISPAPKDMLSNEIESIKQALLYYKERGEQKVIVEPKYMGSKCTIYLAKEIEETRFFSRNGFAVSRKLLPHADLIEAVRPVHQKFEQEWNQGAKLILVQSELMPWSALGKGLIIREFQGYETCHRSHLEYLQNSTLKLALGSLMSSVEFRQYLKDSITLSAKEMSSKYPQHVARQYEALRNLQIPNLQSYKSALDLYHKQVEIYGKDGELHFKPFNWLKMIYEDGREIINDNNISGFKKVSEDQSYVVDLTTNDQEFAEVYDYFNQLVDQEMEGVVIKPEHMWNDQVPMFKVRNNKYLQMIYGIKFEEDYFYYVNKRAVGKKMKCSLNEWKISEALLRIPYSEINEANQNYYELIAKRILEEEFESNLDTRL